MIIVVIDANMKQTRQGKAVAATQAAVVPAAGAFGKR